MTIQDWNTHRSMCDGDTSSVAKALPAGYIVGRNEDLNSLTIIEFCETSNETGIDEPERCPPDSRGSWFVHHGKPSSDVAHARSARFAAIKGEPEVAQSSMTAIPGLVLHVVMRDRAIDLCGHELLIEGTVGPAPGRAGGTALLFHGGCIRVPHDDVFNGAAGILVATWLRVGPLTRRENAIFSKGHWEAGACPWEMSLVPDCWLSFHIFGKRAHERCVAPCPPRGEWHHVAGVWDGTWQYLYVAVPLRGRRGSNPHSR